MPNYDGKYEVTFIYDVTISSRSFEHRGTFDVIPVSAPFIGQDAMDIDVNTKASAPASLVTATDTMFDLLWALMGTGTGQPRFELWEYGNEPSTDKTFITAWEGTGLYETNASPAVAAWQATHTFRTMGGGVARIQLMEGVNGSNSRLTGGLITGDTLIFMNHLISSGSIVTGRDNHWLISKLSASYGQNEALWRKRFRTT